MSVFPPPLKLIQAGEGRIAMRLLVEVYWLCFTERASLYTRSVA